MADDEGGFNFDDPSYNEPEAEAPPAEGEAPPAEAEGVVAEETPAEPVEEEPYVPRPPKPIPEPVHIVCSHWVRPTFLNYHYIYDFQHNYYDDVIDYMDRRLNGICREKPCAQTWAERALRTYTCKQFPGTYYFVPQKGDWQGTLKVAKTWRSQHTTEYFHRKYKTILMYV